MKGKQVEYPSTPAFREIERVLARIEVDWPELMPPEVEDDAANPGGAATRRADFDAVTLALSLLDARSPPERFNSFLRLKDDLGRALKSHIQLHYQAFDTSVSAYNNVLANLGSAQKETNDLRHTLSEVRDILLTRRTELSGMTTRRTELNEMENVLNTLCARVPSP
jgi:exocyst complex component 4